MRVNTQPRETNLRSGLEGLVPIFAFIQQCHRCRHLERQKNKHQYKHRKKHIRTDRFITADSRSGKLPKAITVWNTKLCHYYTMPALLLSATLAMYHPHPSPFQCGCPQVTALVLPGLVKQYQNMPKYDEVGPLFSLQTRQDKTRNNG